MFTKCRNPSFSLATKATSCKVAGQEEGSPGAKAKAKALEGCGPRGSPRVITYSWESKEVRGSVRECEGVSTHTPKATPNLGEGVPVDSRNFRGRVEGSNLNGLLRSLDHWKALET
jgi:hypothetical protein